MSESYRDKIAKELGYSPPPPEAPAAPKPTEIKIPKLESIVLSTEQVRKAKEAFKKVAEECRRAWCVSHLGKWD